MSAQNVTLLASLPMYDLPEVRRETDALWALLAFHMREAGVKDVPGRLNRDDPFEALWLNPDLLVSQSCGLPLMRSYRQTLRPVATPVYRVDGCDGPDYSSAILVSSASTLSAVGELRGKVCAVNSPQSQSGYNAMRSAVAPLAREGRFFSAVRVTGSHRISISAVAAGEADVCAVDCVTYALLARYAPESIAGTRVLGFTPRGPGLPLVVRADLKTDQFERIRSALRQAMADPEGREVRAALFIDGVVETGIDDYRPVLEMEAQANGLGYAELR